MQGFSCSGCRSGNEMLNPITCILAGQLLAAVNSMYNQ
jgi:hypothetical protein